MLLAFAQARTGKAPSQLDVADLDAGLIGAFLTISKQSGTTAPAPATPAWPPSARSSAMPPFATPSTPS